ncbi:MAG: HAMP domain-containing histidine kinase [Deltaproteobacteria bacterium]|nr:HAMP domain-containing histidine kinase [Deltaproteobacteria bacterium]
MIVVNSGLKPKLIIAFLVPTAVAVSASIVASYLEAQKSLESELGERLMVAAGSAAAALSDDLVYDFAPGDQDTRMYKRTLRRLIDLKNATHTARLFAFSPGMKALVDTDPNVEPGDVLYRLERDKVEIHLALEGKQVSSFLFRGKDGNLYKTGYAPIFNREKKVLAVLGADGSTAYFTALSNLWKHMAVVGAVVSLLAVLTGLFVASRLIRPIQNLVIAAKSIGSGDLEQRIEIKGGDEIAFLGKTLEEMRMELLERDRRMQMMLAGIAHEIRNPLGGMELFLGILGEELESSPELLKHLEKVRNELSSLSRIVNDFLGYARPVRLSRKKFDLQELLNEVKELMRKEAAEKEVKLDIEKNDTSLVTADQDLLKRAILNLVKNAIQAVPSKGNVTLSARLEDGEYYEIDVTDDGIGMDVTVLEKATEAFFTTKPRGSGLGLALAAKIAEEHGGRLILRSSRSRGTRATIRIPSKQSGNIDSRSLEAQE